MPLKLKGQTETETADMLARAHAERREAEQAALKVWEEYERQYLTPIDPEEGLARYVAFADRALALYPPVEVPDDLRHESIEHPALQEWLEQSRARWRATLDAFWEAGYLPAAFSLEPLQEGKQFLVWKVKRGAPRPPEQLAVLGVWIPSEGVKLGSKPYKPTSEQPPAYPAHLRPMLTAPPYMFIDRATRDGRNWEHDPTLDLFPFYTDGRSKGMRLTYHPSGDMTGDLQTLAALAVEEVSKLNDRTADVWRCVLWKAMENGPSADNVYGRIRIDTREIAQLLGYKKHHKGGMKPEHLREVQQALSHFERLRLHMDPSTAGTLERDTGQAKGKRKRLPLQKAREERVIAVMAREVERDLYGQTYHMVWEIALGDWARLFPRSYAPMVRALVELPAKGAKAKWAKRIGTELMLHYREDAKNGRGMKRMKWSTLLDRAQLTKEVEELRASRNTARVKTYAVAALDLLQEIGVLERWQEAESHLARTNDGNGKPGNFDRWLESVVEIHAPADVLGVLGTISPPKPKGTGRPRKVKGGED